MLARRTVTGLLIALPLGGCDGGTLPASEERARSAWDQVRTLNQRRAEVLPSLLAVVERHAPQEQEVLKEVADALEAANRVRVDETTPTDPVRWQDYLGTQIRLSNAVQNLLAAVERYLDLKHSSNFLVLRSQLIGLQDRAAVARGDYNAAARAYNAELEGWFSGWLARSRHPNARPLQVFTGLRSEPASP